MSGREINTFDNTQNTNAHVAPQQALSPARRLTWTLALSPTSLVLEPHTQPPPITTVLTPRPFPNYYSSKGNCTARDLLSPPWSLWDLGLLQLDPDRPSVRSHVGGKAWVGDKTFMITFKSRVSIQISLWNKDVFSRVIPNATRNIYQNIKIYRGHDHHGMLVILHFQQKTSMLIESMWVRRVSSPVTIWSTTRWNDRSTQ